MCGIAGYVDFRSGDTSADVLQRMGDAIEHRGPDAGGIWRSGPCGLAHRRLSIIDLKGSVQPMQSPGSGVTLVYNGELYNYRQLRAELVEQGQVFKTEGDTEVILKCIARDWEDAPDRFDGMFATAAWDEARSRLLLARDPLGIKPLFYANPEPGVIVFGSEIKAVLQHPAVDASLDEDALRQALRFRAVYGRRTLHAGVQQLDPGCWLVFDGSGVRTGRYYDLAEQQRQGVELCAGRSESELVELGLERLRAAVEKRLIADVPVGSFLSGGVDSSLIAALVVDLRDAQAETCTYSVGFAGDPHSELPFAKQVADQLGTNHTVVSLTEQDYISLIAGMTAKRDAPISEPADLAIAHMSAIAKRDVKVVLSGEGADEVFCGYPKYGYADAPWALRAGMRVLGPSGAERLAGLLGMDKRRVRTAARALSQPRELDRLTQWFSELDRGMLGELLPGLGWDEAQWRATTEGQRDALQSFEGTDPLVRMQAVDCMSWLPGNLLERGDRMTMAASLEARIPFLDREVVAFGLGLDARLKVRGKTRKWIVREWASRSLPSEIAERPKWGFHVPLDAWFRGVLRDMLHSYLGSPDGICGRYGDPQRVRSLLERHDAGQIDASRALWTLLATEVWYQDVFRKVERRPAPAAVS